MRKLGSLVLLLAVCAAGCKTTAFPRLFGGGPGTAESQQMRAQVFDPYPENDIGPAVVGGRPPEFQNPPPEATRARWVKKTFPWLVNQR